MINTLKQMTQLKRCAVGEFFLYYFIRLWLIGVIAGFGLFEL